MTGATRYSPAPSSSRYPCVAGISPTAEAIRGTAWGAYQAITEYTDHFAPIGEKRNPGAARAERAITSANVAAVKTRAFDLLAAN